MAQHDYVIANQSGSAFRADLNNALAASVSTNSGSSAPSTTYAYMLWADTTNGVLKIRNSANNSWIELFKLDGTDICKLTGSTNNTITTVTGANAIQGEANLTYDGTTLNVGTGSGTTASAGYDEFVIQGGNADIGMNFLSPAANDKKQQISFGDSNNNQSGKIVYDHDGDYMILGTNGAERLRIESGGNVKITDGDLVIGTAGHGIDFSASESGSVSTNGSILDDYEKGTFTPSISSTCRSGTITYGNAVGFYTKIGNRVFAQFYMHMSGGTNTGNAFFIDGLPFTCISTASHEGGGYHTYMGGLFTAEADRVNEPWVGLDSTAVKFHTHNGSQVIATQTSTGAQYLIFHVQYIVA